MEIIIDNKKYSVDKPRLKRWVQSELVKKELNKQSEEHNLKGVIDRVVDFVNSVSGIDKDNLHKARWIDVANAFSDCVDLCRLQRKYPMYDAEYRHPAKEDVWEYDGRLWYIWVHTLAKEYGWDVEYISGLDVDDATALFQEIQVQAQLDREFVWMTSENAYSYNQASKKSEFRPLPRPPWMMDEIRYAKTPQKKVIPKNMMPVGHIVRGAQLPNAITPRNG